MSSEKKELHKHLDTIVSTFRSLNSPLGLAKLANPNFYKEEGEVMQSLKYLEANFFQKVEMTGGWLRSQDNPLRSDPGIAEYFKEHSEYSLSQILDGFADLMDLGSSLKGPKDQPSNRKKKVTSRRSSKQNGHTTQSHSSDESIKS